MRQVLPGVLPVFLLILFGYGIRRAQLLTAEFWDPAEKLVYYALFPALLITTLASADLSSLTVGPMAGALVASILTVTGILLALRLSIGMKGVTFASVLQGAIRQNTYIGLAVTSGLFGAEGLAIAAIAVAVVVPLVNVLSVAALSRYGPETRGAWETLRRVATNPLVLACVVGGLLQASGLGLPLVVGDALRLLGRGALPLGLLTVGAALRPSGIRDSGAWVGLASALKLIVLPALTSIACWTFGVSRPAASVAILFSALPTGAASYVLTRQLGGDHELMASLITLEALAALVTMPVVLTLLVTV